MHDRFLDLINEIYNLFVLLREGYSANELKIRRSIRKVDGIWVRIKKKILRTFA